jgi:hypothetical protein
MGDSEYSAGGLQLYGTSILRRVTITGNTSGQGTGAIYNAGTLTLRDSLVAFNEGTNGAIRSVGTVSIVNSTISSNTGLGHAASVDLARGEVRSSTLYGNVGNVGALFQDTLISNSVVSNDAELSCQGTIESQGHNFFDHRGECTVTGWPATDTYGRDPALSHLRDNGGGTLSHVPLPGSPLIDAGNEATPPSQLTHCTRIDQIGMLRPQDGDGDGEARCDIGATERRTMAGPVPADLYPGRCPNNLALGDTATIKVALVGRAILPASRFDPRSVQLMGVNALRWRYVDVGTAYEPFTGKSDPTECSSAGADGRGDLLLEFDKAAVASALGQTTNGQAVVLRVTGRLKDAYGGTPFRGEDVALIRK